MRTIFTKIIFLSIIFMLSSAYVNAQNGLDSIIVEKYYISNAADSAGSIGILPIGSVTYRIYVSMLPGYNFQMAYGNSTHPLSITTSTSFFNNEDYGATTPSFTKTNAKKNTVMLDSWLSAGAACVGNYGVLKTKDNGVATVINANNILQNTDTLAGIPLTVQDGLLTGTPATIGTIGIDTAIAVFDATSQFGNSFIINNGAWYCLGGATGPDTTNNQVLIAQITTKGRLNLKLNIQIGTPSGGVEKYVADSIIGGFANGEIQRNFLTYLSDSIPVVIDKVNDLNSYSTISIFPNPSKGIFNLNINTKSMSQENYFTIYNIIGNTLVKKRINTIFNNYNEAIDLDSYPKGIYFIEVSINGEKTTRKLIKN
ncbi:MAG: T9SS type A sorting domain-containing protein [Bacteroidota bacterium]